jgi:hypothetical protein
MPLTLPHFWRGSGPSARRNRAHRLPDRDRRLGPGVRRGTRPLSGGTRCARPLDDLKLGVERELWLSRFILGRLAQVYSVPRERDCQIHMLRSVIAKVHNRL